jgi:hypothetical protein
MRQIRSLYLSAALLGIVLAALPAPAIASPGTLRESPGIQLLRPATAGQGPKSLLQARARAARARSITDGQRVSTVPFFQSAFTYGGTTYPYQIVGTNPASSSGSTLLRTILVPIDLTFEDSSVPDPTLDGSSTIARVLASPIFIPTRFAATGEFTQYLDAVQRAEFWNVLRNRPKYHTFLVPRVVAPVHLTVPASMGDKDDRFGTGIPLGYVDGQWWNQQLVDLISALHIRPGEVPVFITRDTLAGFAAGFHDALTVTQPDGSTAIYPFAWASFYDYGFATGLGFAPDFAADVEVLGHEIVELANDPFITNTVPEWSFSLPPLVPNGCSNVLETGDPLELAIFQAQRFGFTYHLQDEAFLSWFARQTPSIGYAGRYSFLGTFSSYSTSCS